MIRDKIKRLINHYLFSEDLSRDARILNMICVVGFFAGIVSLTSRVFEGMPPIVIGVMISYIISIIALFFIANYFDAHQLATSITLIALGDVIFPLTFFMTGGVNSALSVWFVCSIFVVVFFARGAVLAFYLGLHIIAIIVCYWLSAVRPDLVYQDITWAQRVSEQITAIFASGFFIGLSVKYLISIYDTERKKAETASLTKSNFLSTMSHEMRTPMNAIIGMTAIAKSTDDAAKKDYALERIEEASEHLLGVINDILDMSKIEAGKLELSCIEFNFARTLQKVKTIITPRVDEKRQNFTIDIDKNIPATLISDDQRLTQVILNLLSNAVKFTDSEGRITIVAELLGEEDGVCEIQVVVSDTGIGLSEDQVGRLFGSFEQAESGTSRKYGGTGLGLAISKNIIDLLGGRIWVKSTPGEGSRFFFTFKAKPGTGAQTDGATEPESPEDAEAAAAALLSGKRILLAEDNEINREIVIVLLEPVGIEIDCAVNGAEALAKFKAAPHSYDMILLDCMMPEMDGYEATQSIRALPEPYAQRIPIVAMTANVFQEDIDKCIASGMNAHIGKPVDYGNLLVVLRDSLRG
ncbi:MAG: response regulator [Oscillospiraceae bacterium]|jgi:signal transduction histidine kinase|nr:response regulator [Oscillospiraceae bacterium]